MKLKKEAITLLQIIAENNPKTYKLLEAKALGNLQGLKGEEYLLTIEKALFNSKMDKFSQKTPKEKLEIGTFFLTESMNAYFRGYKKYSGILNGYASTIRIMQNSKYELQ